LNEVHTTGLSSIKRSEVGMKRILVVCALGVMGLAASAAHAEMSLEAARASVAPFYKALNAEFARRPRRAGSPAAAMMSATAAMRSSPGSGRGLRPFRT
jgi:hypothetical protein